MEKVSLLSGLKLYKESGLILHTFLMATVSAEEAIPRRIASTIPTVVGVQSFILQHTPRNATQLT